MVAPVLPLLTDSTEALDALLARIAAAGATGATVLALHLRPGAREWFQAWLAREHPALVEPYARLYRRGPTSTRRTAVPSPSAWRRCCAATGSPARSPRSGGRAPASEPGAAGAVPGSIGLHRALAARSAAAQARPRDAAPPGRVGRHAS